MEQFPDIVAVMVRVSVEGPVLLSRAGRHEVVRGSIVAVPLGPRSTLGVVWGPPKDLVRITGSRISSGFSTCRRFPTS